MRKLLLIGAMLIIGALSYGVTEILQPGNDGTYKGSTKLQLRVDGNAVSQVSGAWLEITPIMSKGSNNSSMEFRFGELIPGTIARVEGSFAAEVKEYDDSGRATKLQFTGLSNSSSITTDGNLYIGIVDKSGIDKNGQDLTLKTAATQAGVDVGTIRYTLVKSKGGLVGTNDRYEGYIESEVSIKNDAKPGEFFNNDVYVLVKVKSVEGKREGK